MLSIQPLKSATAAANYYTEAFNYYANDAQAMRWLGNGRQYLALGEGIEKDQMLALLEGKLPIGQQLQNPKGEHRPGFDMTFSAPKSVSLLVGLGVAPELEQFHDKAVEYAIAQIEKEFAETRIWRDGKLCYEKTGNLLIAAFRQPSSRANDPALHTHCVTMNMTFLEGKARSLASDTSRIHGVVENIQNNAHYCGLIYRSYLANQLKEAGFQLRQTGDGLFEINGIPENVLREFSRRREDIEMLLKEKGWVGAKSASSATLLTRNGKEEMDLDTLRADWQERAESLAFDAKVFLEHRGKTVDEPTSLWSSLKRHITNLIGKEDAQLSEHEVARASVDVAIEALSQRTAVFSERMLVAEGLKHVLIYEKPVSHQAIMDAVTEKVKSQGLYEAKALENNERVFTTPWLLTLEAETLARIEENKGCISAISTQKEVIQYQKAEEASLKHPLTASQKEAMVALLVNQDRFMAIQGYAGVAKTSMLNIARPLIESKGYSLRGITVASSAANELFKKARIDTDVFPIVHEELRNAKTSSLSKTVFIVDEASMLSTHQGHELLKQVERTNARLVLMGDKAQLPSVNTGRIFSLTQDYGIKTAMMTDIVRQQNQKTREAVVHATKGEVKAALEKLDVKTLATHDERIQWIASHWLGLSKEDRSKTLLFAPTHANRKAITMLIRDGLKAEGELTPNGVTHTTLETKSLESIQQRFVQYYRTGQIVKFNQSFDKNKIKSGEYYRVNVMTSKHLRDNVLPLISSDGKTRTFPLKNLPNYKTHTAAFERQIELYEPKTMELSKGDKLMWTRNFKAFDIRNGETFQIEKIEKGAYYFKRPDGSDVVLDKSHPALQHIDYSYVLTNYKVQGKDAPYGVGLMESYHRFGASLKNFYVQISRAIHGMTLVTDDKESLINAIQKNNDDKSASLDIIKSREIQQHSERFKNQININLNHVIHKKFEIENKAISKSSHQEKMLDMNEAIKQKTFKELEI